MVSVSRRSACVAILVAAHANALRLPAKATVPIAEGVRQSLAGLSCAALIALGTPYAALAEDAPLTPAACKLECFRECDNLAPGNKGYCTTQCDMYCDSLPAEKTGSGD